MIVLNTPHNPVGKVFTRSEIEVIADIAKEFNLLVMSDEVVRIVNPEVSVQSHIFQQPSTIVYCTMARSICGLQLFRGCGRGRSPLALRGVSLVPSFAFNPFISVFRTESFAATGWRVGWLIGPESIIKPTLAASTRIIFCSNSLLQEAAAAGLERAKEYNFFPTQNKEYAERRDILLNVFDDLGMKYTLPQGSYFILLVCQSVAPKSSHSIPSVAYPFSIRRTYQTLIYPPIIRSPIH